MAEPKYSSSKVYVVFKGRQPGIYYSWPECDLQVSSFKGNIYKAYDTSKLAENVWLKFCKSNVSGKECSQSSTYSHMDVGGSPNAGSSQSRERQRKSFDVHAYLQPISHNT